MTQAVSPAWRGAIRRGLLPLALGLACFVVARPAIEDLDRLLKGLGVILVVLGLVIIVATGRTLSAQRSGQAER
jgi:hypothetical protein